MQRFLKLATISSLLVLLYLFSISVDSAAQTWSAPVNVSNNSGGSGDPVIAADSSGNVHLVWEDVTGIGGGDIFYSKYAGASWSNPINISNTPFSGAASSRPDIAADSSGNLHVVWYEERFPNNSEIFYGKFNGSSWSSPITISNTGGLGAADFPAIAVDALGKLHVVWQLRVSSSNYEIYYGRFDGTSWSTAINLSNSPGNLHNPVIVIDSSGGINAGWIKSGDIFHTKSTNGGASWSIPVNLSQAFAIGSSRHLAISADTSGVIHGVAATNEGSSTSFKHDIFYRRMVGVSVSGPTNISNNIGESERPKIALDSLSKPHVVWQDSTPSGNPNFPDIFYSRLDGASWFTPVNISNNASSSVNPDIAVDSNSNVHAVWQDLGLNGFYDIFHSRLSCAQPPPNLVSWWPGDESANDVVGANHGILQNGASLALGLVRQAFSLDGVNDFVNIPDAPSLDLTTYTFDAWIYWTGGGDVWQGILSKGPLITGTTENYAIFVNRDGRYLHHVLNIGGVRYIFDTPSNLMPLNTWIHVAGSFDGSVAKTYINGELKASLAVSGLPATNNFALRIGHREGSPHYFKGLIDEVSIYNRALSQSEIQAIFTAGSLGKCAIAKEATYTHSTRTLSIEFSGGDPASLAVNSVRLYPLNPPTGQPPGIFDPITLHPDDVSTVSTNASGNKIWDIKLRREEQVKIGKWKKFGLTNITMTIQNVVDTSTPMTITWNSQNQSPTTIAPTLPATSLPSQTSSGSQLQIPLKVEDNDKDIDFIKIKYKINGRGEKEVVISNPPSADETIWSGAIPSLDLTAAGLSYIIESSDSLGETIKNPISPKRRWVKVKDAIVKSNERVGGAAEAPLLIPDSTKTVTDVADIKSAKRQFYRLFSIPVDVIERKTSLNLDLDQIFENLGSYTVPSSDINSRKSGYFISNFKGGSWTTQKVDAALSAGQGGLIRAVASTLGGNNFIQLTGSSTPPEGDKDDAATGKLNRTAVEPAHTGVDVELKPGWNIVGVPMYRRFFWSLSSTGGIRVVDTNGVDMGSVGNSIANGVVSPVIYGGYNGSAYTKTIDARDINLSATDSSRVMQPFEGYWVFAFLPCKLRFLASADSPDSATTTAPPMMPEKERLFVNEGWGISLSAKTINSIDGGNIIGYGFKEVDYLKPPSLFEDDVRLSILEEDGLELTRSLVNRLEDKDFVGAQHVAPYTPYWDIKVDSTGEVPVTISGEILNLPKDYQVILIDSAGKELANLKEAPYTYVPRHAGLEVFKIVVAKKRFVPKTSALLQNYPNPFNPETWIPYQLSSGGNVTISIYNVQGRLVRRLSLGYKEAGVYIRKEEAGYWDGRNSLGERVSSGLYFYSIQAGQFVATRKMVVVK